jgi:hypothetical protein
MPRSREELVEALRELGGHNLLGAGAMLETGETISIGSVLTEAADLLDSLEERFVVLGAPGWPGGYEPVPNTLETARQFVSEHGGQIRRRHLTPWTDVEEGTDG